MYSKAYIRGFTEKLAELGKSAKLRYEMTAKERKEADRAMATYDKKRLAEALPNPEELPASSILGEWGRHGRMLGRKLQSLGRGAASAASVTGLRALEGLGDIAVFAPEMLDSLIFGSMLGINDGHGFIGEQLGKGHRKIDELVHKARMFSEQYDYKNRINSPLNRAMRGTAADALGTFIGFGGLSGIATNGAKRVSRKLAHKAQQQAASKFSLSKLVGPALGATNVLSEFNENSPHRQLREREAYLRSMHPLFRGKLDPTATVTNQIAAPTTTEYRKYYLPWDDLPTSPTGKITLPWMARHREDGLPTQYVNFGE